MMLNQAIGTLDVSLVWRLFSQGSLFYLVSVSVYYDSYPSFQQYASRELLRNIQGYWSHGRSFTLVHVDELGKGLCVVSL